MPVTETMGYRARGGSQGTDALCNKTSQLLREVKMPNKEIQGNKGLMTAMQTKCQSPATVLSTTQSGPFTHARLSGVNPLSMSLTLMHGSNEGHLCRVGLKS